MTLLFVFYSNKKETEAKVHSFPSMTQSRSCNFNFYPTGQNLVVWLNAATKEAGKCSLFLVGMDPTINSIMLGKGGNEY